MDVGDTIFGCLLGFVICMFLTSLTPTTIKIIEAFDTPEESNKFLQKCKNSVGYSGATIKTCVSGDVTIVTCKLKQEE